MEKSVNELKCALKEKCVALQSLIRENASLIYENADKNLVPSMIAKIDSLVDEVDQWRYRIYMIGEFSCGKSSLLNAFLQRPNLLPRANTAETAVTTEICYGQENCVKYCYLDGTEKTESGYDERVAEKIRELGNEQKIKKVVLQLDLPVLQKYEELSFVDMPGLSSTNVAHEDSLNRFLQEGGLGLICVAMKDGDIHGSLINFLKSTCCYHFNCNVVLTKMDDCPSAERENVRNKIVSTIERNLGVSVIDSAMVSTYDANYDISEFEAMIEKLSQEQTEYFNECFSKRFLDLVSESTSPIRVALCERYANDNLDEKIEKVKNEKNDLPSFFDGLSMDMDRSVSRIVENTLSFARTVLNGSESEFIQSAKAGRDIASGVRSSLNTAIQSKLHEELEDLTCQIVERAKEKLENVMKGSHEEAQVDVGGWSNEKSGGAGHPFVGAAFGTLSGVAAGAAIGSIFPVIGTALGAVFGGILGLLGGGIAGCSIDRDSDVESKVEQFLDDCVERARSSVERICRDAIDVIKNNVKDSVENKMNDYSKVLETLQKEKREGEQVFNDKQQKRMDLKEQFDALTIF